MEKEAVIHVRVEQSKYDTIKKKADELGLSISSFVRMVITEAISK